MAKKQLLAVGPPPLTTDAADASIDLIDFMAAKVRGVDLIDVTPVVREAWRYRLATYWPVLDEAARWWCVNTPRMLEYFQTHWDEMGYGEQNQVKQIWAAQLPSLLPAVEATLEVAASSSPGGQQQYATGRGGRSYSQRADDVNSLLSQIHQRQHEDEENAFNEGGTDLQLLVKKHHENVNSTMLTNFAQMRYEAMMNTARAFKY